MKCTEYLKYGSIVELDHISVVEEKQWALLISAATLSLVFLYSAGIATLEKYLADGISYLGSRVSTR